MHISSPEIHRGKVLKIYHLNDLFNIFPYYDFGENYRENDQNDSLQSSYWFILYINSFCVTVFLNWCLVYQSSSLYNNYYVAVINLCLIKNFVLKVHLNIFIKNIWLGLSLAKIGCKLFKCQPYRVVKHTQTICRFLLKICLSVYDFFCGTGDKGVDDVNINFFLDKFHIDALLLCFFH